jgi:hypothetical protein
MAGPADGTTGQIRRRLVLFFPGFEPLGAEQHRGRFVHALTKTGPVYGAEYETTALESRPSGIPAFTVTGSGKGWRTETDIVIFDWSPVLEHFAKRNVLDRFASGLISLAGFILRGTLFRYLVTSWRYGLFFAYPLVLILACIMVAHFAGSLSGGGINGWMAGTCAGGLLAWIFARKAHLLLMMDDWSFAASVCEGKHAIIEDVRKTFRSVLQRELTGAYDEVLVIGHSLGCVYAVDALAGAEPQEDRRISLLTTGSSLLKIALDRQASWLCDDVKRIIESGTQWLDVQALTDVISFFGSNPAEAAGIFNAPFLKIIKVRFRKMLLPQSYAKGKFNLFRTHRQFVLAVERPYFYSLHQIACGPVPFDLIWKTGGLPEHMVPPQNPD